MSYVFHDVGNADGIAAYWRRASRIYCAIFYRGLFVKLVHARIGRAEQDLRDSMGKTKPKKQAPEKLQSAVTINQRPVTVSQGSYKPIPRFRGGCNKC